MTDGPYDFVAKFDGEDDKTFATIQSAMVYAEDIPTPTGTISLNGVPVVNYQDGEIDVVEPTFEG